MGQSPHLFPEAPSQAFPTKSRIWVERTFWLFSKAENPSLSGCSSSLPPEVGASHAKPQNPRSCRQRCPQHDTKNTTQRERSRTAVRTLQVYLTRFRREDLIFGSPGSSSSWKLCPWNGALSSGIAAMHGVGRTSSNPPRSSVCSTGHAQPVSPLGASTGVHHGMESTG